MANPAWADDAREYDRMRQAMEEVGIDPRQQQEVLSTLAALVHLRAVEFAAATEDELDLVNVNVTEDELDQVNVNVTEDQLDQVNVNVTEDELDQAAFADPSAVQRCSRLLCADALHCYRYMEPGKSSLTRHALRRDPASAVRVAGTPTRATSCAPTVSSAALAIQPRLNLAPRASWRRERSGGWHQGCRVVDAQSLCLPTRALAHPFTSRSS